MVGAVTIFLLIGVYVRGAVAPPVQDIFLSEGRRLSKRQQRHPPQEEQAQQTSFLENLAAAAGPAIAWDWAAPIGASNSPDSDGCSWSAFEPPSARVNSSICLRPGADLLADTIRRKHYWPECADLPAMFAAAPASDDPQPSAQAAAAALFIDIGANVLACSVHMLLASDATVVSFEPGPDNAFYASRSLLRLTQEGGPVPDAAKRLLLMRAALGTEASGEQLLHQAVGNAGHAVIGQKPTQYAPLGHVAAQKILIRRLDDLLWPPGARSSGTPAPSIALLKVDVEGYECEVIKGMPELLKAGAVASMKLEVFDILLRVQGCSAAKLQRLVADAGFLLYRSGEDSTGLPSKASLLAPETVPMLAQGVPYNLWCVRQRAPTAEGMAAAPPSPPSGGDAATPGGVEADRRRRRQLVRKQRTARRLADLFKMKVR